MEAHSNIPGPMPSTTPQDIQTLLAPVQVGLQQVERKMKRIDSSLFAPLSAAFVDLIGRGGKRLRPALVLMAAEFNGEIQGTPRYDKVISLAASVEMLHTATLVHDDVIDDALLRRGAPTLNVEWSKGATVLAGNYMFGRATQFSAETGSMRVIRIFSDTLQIIVDGELHQLFARNQFHQEKDNYYRRIYAKTASLFCAATEGAAALSNLPETDVKQLRDYGYNLGMAFQIVDDILDFTGDEHSLGKPAGSDLRQGTLTLPFFYWLRTHSRPETVIAELEEHADARDEGDEQGWIDAANRIAAEIRDSDAIEAARAESHEFLARAKESLTGLPDNVYKTSMLGLCDFVEQRTY